VVSCNLHSNILPLPLLSISLLLNFALDTPLQRLALIMLQLPLLLLRLIACQTRPSTTHSPTNTVTNALSKIAQLALGLLAFTLGILLLAGFAHALETQGASHGLFAGADSLVPRPGRSVGVVSRDALGADGVAANVGAGVGEFLAGFAFGFLLLGLVLGLEVSDRWVACGA